MVAADVDVDGRIVWRGVDDLGGDKIIDKKMKKEVCDRVKEVFCRFPAIDRLWLSAKGGVFLDSTRENGLTMVKRSEIDDNETKEDKQ